MERQTKSFSLSNLITVFAMLAIIISGIKGFERYSDGYIIAINIGSIIIAAIVMVFKILSLFKNWDVINVSYSNSKTQSFEDKKKALISHIRSFSAWYDKDSNEAQLNKMLQVSMNKVEEAVIVAEEALEDYYKKINH